MSTSCRWTFRSTSKPSSIAFTTRTTFRPSSRSRGSGPARAIGSTFDCAQHAAILGDLRARLARRAEEPGLGEGRELRRLGDKNPPIDDEPPPQRLRTHCLRGKQMIHVIAIITANPGMRDAILKEFHANM